jgi:hypothetical protein
MKKSLRETNGPDEAHGADELRYHFAGIRIRNSSRGYLSAVPFLVSAVRRWITIGAEAAVDGSIQLPGIDVANFVAVGGPFRAIRSTKNPS